MKAIVFSALFFLTALTSFGNESNESREECNYTLRDSVAIYAQQYLGTPYVWGGVSESGFDCSGFVLYVFKKFGIELPHSSRILANLGEKRDKNEAKTGDLILFKGRNSSSVGHVGIVYNNVENGELIFIHSSSPRSGGVIFSSLNESYYKGKFVKIVDILS